MIVAAKVLKRNWSFTVAAGRKAKNSLPDMIYKVLGGHEQTTKKSLHLFELDRLILGHHPGMKVLIESASVTSPPWTIR